MKHRAAIEPTIGHLKAEHRLESNRLKGTQPGWILALMLGPSVLFSAAGLLSTSVVMAKSAHPTRYLPFFRTGSTVACIVTGH
jgi:hypothetical protein